jgi:hypothetical protein
MDIEVVDLSYAVGAGVGVGVGQGKALLHSVCASFPAGVVNILMGHSGAGTALQCVQCSVAVDACMHVYAYIYIYTNNNTHNRSICWTHIPQERPP